MRTLEIIAGLMVAAVVFVGVKLLGVVLHMALVAAVLGLLAGLAIARMLRNSSVSQVD